MNEWMIAYRPEPGWFLHDANGIHGLGHLARVTFWADILARETRHTVDVEVVRYSAALHDVRRLNDGSDPEHGERASEWLLEQTDILDALTQDQREAVAYCCRWHVRPDYRAPRMTPELIVLKDADALDRVRLGDLNPAFLRLDRACQLRDDAARLYEETRETPTWDGVRRAATRLVDG